jgi:predicted peptidase
MARQRHKPPEHVRRGDLTMKTHRVHRAFDHPHHRRSSMLLKLRCSALAIAVAPLLASMVLMGLPLLHAEDGEAFEKRTYTGDNGKVLPYRLLKPEHYDPKIHYPLVLFMHGAFERGVDNERQLFWVVKDFAKPAVRAQHPCFVIAPQCDPAYRWCEVDWSEPKSHKMPKEPSVPMGLLIELLPKFAKEFSIDANREYVVGLSMGGFGAWDLIGRFPTRFAAATPICGGADITTAPSLVKMPIWVFHGSADGAVHPERSRDMVAALKQAGSTVVKYTEYPGVGHGSWVNAFQEPDFMSWLFAQNLADQRKSH